jgi:hypothetical protein
LVPAGLVSGDHGSQLAHPSPSCVSFLDDFLGDVIADQWNARVGSDASGNIPGAAIVGSASNAQIGGVLRLSTGDATASMAVGGIQLEQVLNWQAGNGGLAFEARVNFAAITSVACFIGFTDQAAALEMPIQSAASANTITTNATDAVGFMFDTSMATANWWLVGVANDTDATAQNSGFAPAAGVFETLRVGITATGAATFHRNGKQVGSRMTGALTPATDLTPVVAMFPRTTAVKTFDVDYVHVSMNR